MSSYISVIDTSAWQAKYTGSGGKLKPGALPFNFQLAADAGVEAVIHRIGNGRSFDESFPMAHESARDAGLLFGAYYYVQPNVGTPDAIADKIVSWLTVNGIELDLRFMLDCEKYDGERLGNVEYGVWLRALIDALIAREMPVPIIYTSAWWWNDYCAQDFSDIDTMQARYRTGRIPPNDARLWPEWAFDNVREPRDCIGLRVWDGWQFSSEADGTAFGVPTDAATRRLDTNIVRAEAFARWIVAEGVEPPAPEPEPEQEMTLEEIAAIVGPWDPQNGKVQLWPWYLGKATIRKGSRGKAVEYLQGMLRLYVDPSIEVTGTFDEHTDTTVRNVQTLFKVTVDGVVGWHGDANNPGPQATWPIIDLLPWFASQNEGS